MNYDSFLMKNSAADDAKTLGIGAPAKQFWSEQSAAEE